MPSESDASHCEMRVRRDRICIEKGSKLEQQRCRRVQRLPVSLEAENKIPRRS